MLQTSSCLLVSSLTTAFALFSKLRSFVTWRFWAMKSTICREHLHLQHSPRCFVKNFLKNLEPQDLNTTLQYFPRHYNISLVCRGQKSYCNSTNARLIHHYAEHLCDKSMTGKRPSVLHIPSFNWISDDILSGSRWCHGVYTLWSVSAWHG